jgi:uncharacterized protein (DUF952 family)
VIFHIARAADWNAAQHDGEYRVSTLGRTLEQEGFIHCSASPAQGAYVLRAFYADVDEPLVVLTVDTERVPSEVRFEAPEGTAEQFPHVYGPLPTGAVSTVAPIARVDGELVWPDS